MPGIKRYNNINVLHLTLEISVILNTTAFMNNCKNQFSCPYVLKLTRLNDLGSFGLVGNTLFPVFCKQNLFLPRFTLRQ